MGFHWLVCFEVKMYFEYLFKNDDISHLTSSWCTQNFKTKLELTECTIQKINHIPDPKNIYLAIAKKKSGKKTRRKNLASPW